MYARCGGAQHSNPRCMCRPIGAGVRLHPPRCPLPILTPSVGRCRDGLEPAGSRRRSNSDKFDRKFQTRSLFGEAGTRRGRAVVGATGHYDIEFVQTKHTGRPRRKTSGGICCPDPFGVLRPIPIVRIRGVAPAEFSIGTKLDHPRTFADRRFEPGRIFALRDQLKLLRCGAKHNGDTLTRP